MQLFWHINGYFISAKKPFKYDFINLGIFLALLTDYKKQRVFIKFYEPEFKNSINSLGLILKNKTIHDKVLDNYQNREVQTLGNIIGKYSKIKKIINLNKNVKITSIMPKAFEKDFQEQKNNKKELDYNSIEKTNKIENSSKILNIKNNTDYFDSKSLKNSNKKDYFKLNGLSSFYLVKGSAIY